MSTESDILASAEQLEQTAAEDKKERSTLQLIGWFSVGMAVAALGIFLGAELRSRSKFKRRTPYDFYSNAAESQSSEFGVGI